MNFHFPLHPVQQIVSSVCVQHKQGSNDITATHKMFMNILNFKQMKYMEFSVFFMCTIFIEQKTTEIKCVTGNKPVRCISYPMKGGYVFLVQ